MKGLGFAFGAGKSTVSPSAIGGVLKLLGFLATEVPKINITPQDILLNYGQSYDFPIK